VELIHPAAQLWVCADGHVTKFLGDVEAYKVSKNCVSLSTREVAYALACCLPLAVSHRGQHQGQASSVIAIVLTCFVRPVMYALTSFHGLIASSSFVASGRNLREK
jgi:hypothetical protein